MRKAGVVAVFATVATLAAACGGSSSGGKSGTNNNQGQSSKTIKVGILTSLTGSSAPGFTGVEKAAKARFSTSNDGGEVNGVKFTYVMADDASSPAGAAAGVRKLVQQDHVDAIIEVSPFFFGGFSVAVQSGVPTFGTGFDGGPEWLDQKNKNLFNILGSEDYTKVADTLGKITKALGVTKMGGVGYIEAPSARMSVNAFIASSQKAGIAPGYHTNVHFGSTDVGPVVLGIKNSKTDGFYTSTIPNTAFAVVGGLAQAGVKMKAILLATGYGGELLQSKEAVAAGNGAYFLGTAAPVELHTPATEAFQAGLAKYAGAGPTDIPGFSEYMGWIAADAVVAAYKGAGSDTSKDNVVSTFRTATWDGAGLYPKPIDFSTYGDLGSAGMGPGNCTYVIQLKDGKFVPVQGLAPVCGDLIPGLTVKP
jgi:branched-chain amino acid transport system substrate-binding protein